MSDNRICKEHSRLRCSSCEEIESLRRENEIMRSALEEIKNNGTRHDLNPTGRFKPCGCFDSFSGDNWQGYIRSQDEFVRELCREALLKCEEL